MGVDFYQCNVCDESIYEEYVGWCNHCQSRLCTNCLINKDVDYTSEYAHSYGYRYDPSKPKLMLQYIAEGFELYTKEGEPHYEINDIIDDSGIDKKYCPYCSGDKIDKEVLFNYIVDKYKIDINEEWAKYKKFK